MSDETTLLTAGLPIAPPAASCATPCRWACAWSALKQRSVWMIFIGALAMVATLPGRTHGLGLVTKPLMDDLQLSATAMGDLNLWATLLGAAACMPGGWLIDRYGLRRSLSLILLALGLVVMAMSRVQTITGLFVAITLTRALGQSMLSLASLAVVGKWFAGPRVGLAMGAYSVLLGIGFAGAFPTVGAIVQAEGWRVAWSWIGFVIAVGVAPLAAWLTRDPPSQAIAPQALSLQVPRAITPGLAASAASANGARWHEALRAPAFWSFALCSSYFLFVNSGISLFNQAIFAERGFPVEVYYDLAGLGFLIGMVANLVGGWLVDRVSLRWQMAVAMALIAGALAMFPSVQTRGELYLYAMVLAGSGGLVTVVFFAVWAQLFGKRDLGRIQGVAQFMTVVASALGPQLLGICFDQTGSYLTYYPYLAYCGTALAIIVASVPLPRPVVAPAETVQPLAA